MFARADLQTDVRTPHIQILKEDVGEVFVVVLPGVDEHGIYVGIGFQGMEQRRHFHEIGPSPNHTSQMDVLQRWLSLEKDECRTELSNQGMPRTMAGPIQRVTGTGSRRQTLIRRSYLPLSKRISLTLPLRT